MQRHAGCAQHELVHVFTSPQLRVCDTRVACESTFLVVIGPLRDPSATSSELHVYLYVTYVGRPGVAYTRARCYGFPFLSVRWLGLFW